MDPSAHRKSPRLNKNLKTADSVKKAEKKKRKTQTVEEPGAKRRLISAEPAVVEAKHVRCVNADDIFPNLQEFMDAQWGPKDIRGFKESSVRPEWSDDFYRHYELVFGKKEVTNRHVPEYFARAFALHLAGKKVDWDSFKFLAKDLAKGGARESAVTEEVGTSKSASKIPKVQQVFYPKEELEFAETLLQHCHEKLLANSARLEDLKVQPAQLRDSINKLQGRKDAHEEDLAQIQHDIEKVLDDAKQSKQRDIKEVQDEIKLLNRDRIRKEETLRKLQEPLDRAIEEKAQCEHNIAELQDAHKDRFECCRRLDDMHKFMQQSAAILLQPKSGLVISPAEEKIISVKECTFCTNGFANNEPMLVAPCEHAFHVFCFSYSISAKLSCPRACKWDENISKMLGVYFGGK